MDNRVTRADKVYKVIRSIRYFILILVLVVIVVATFLKRKKMEDEYNAASVMLSSGNYDDAYQTFSEIDNYYDSEQKAKLALYEKALKLKDEKKYQEAAEIFSQLGNFNDSREQYNACKEALNKLYEKIYNEAKNNFEEGSYEEALKSFSILQEYNYLDSGEYAIQCQDRITRLSMATTLLAWGRYSVGIGKDSIYIAGDHKSVDFSEWDDVISVAGGESALIGLKIDGTVVIANWTDDEQLFDECKYWKDIVDIAAGDHYVIALDKNGKVFGKGAENKDFLNFEAWKNLKIVDIASGWCHVAGVDDSGKVHILGKGAKEQEQQIESSVWPKIIKISAGGGNNTQAGHTVGLGIDGKIYAVGNNSFGQCDVTEIAGYYFKDVAAGDRHTVGLLNDGSVVTIGHDGTINYINQNPDEKIDNWKKVVAISAGSDFSLALKVDGSVYAAGAETQGQLDARKWEDIFVYR